MILCQTIHPVNRDNIFASSDESVGEFVIYKLNSMLISLILLDKRCLFQNCQKTPHIKS
jgi:uncharacterized membrane protein